MTQFVKVDIWRARLMSKAWNATKIGYDQESLYFHEQDRKLIEEIRRKRAAEVAAEGKQVEQAKLAEVISFPNARQERPKKKAA